MSYERLGEKLYRNMNLPKSIREALSKNAEKNTAFELTQFFDKLKNEIENKIACQQRPTIELRSRNGFNLYSMLGYSESRINNNIDTFKKALAGKDGKYLLILKRFLNWMEKQGLEWECSYSHDGGGIESWTTLDFFPSPSLIQELNESKPRFLYKRK